MGLKDIIAPFYVWKRAFEKPYTAVKPLTERPGAPRYRGFHQNDNEKCIGCGTCEEICQNAAIDMVPVDGIDTTPGDSGLRPKIDYGRCCWCALCVDICTTGSLTMSNEYIWIDSDPEVFRFVPGNENKPWDEFAEGYRKSKDYNLLELDRIPMEILDTESRIDSFIEMVKGYSQEQALEEARRCVECGICVATCPAHMDIPNYIKAIREKDLNEGLRILYDTNPLPEICGRVCTHKCEETCAIGHQGNPISIRWLKRYIADQFPLEQYKEVLKFSRTEPSGKKVAVIGSGPAGLAAAYYLSLLGHYVKIYDKYSEPGGMMRYGIPEYRLPYDQIDKDIDFIKSLGVEIVTGTEVGKDIPFTAVQNDSDAVFLGTGLHLGRSTRVPGADHDDVHQAIDLLRLISEGKTLPLKEKIIIIGGGNVAMDIARTYARLQMQEYGKVNIILTCLETEDIMPADREEIDESREEHIELRPGYGPEEIEIEQGRIKGLKVIRCLSVFDKEGRFNPKFDSNSKNYFIGNMIVEAIGQGMDLSYLPEELRQQLKFEANGRIKVNNDLQSSISWLYTGGDMISGPDIINAIANGHKAAKAIDKFLRSKGK